MVIPAGSAVARPVGMLAVAPGWIVVLTMDFTSKADSIWEDRVGIVADGISFLMATVSVKEGMSDESRKGCLVEDRR